MTVNKESLGFKLFIGQKKDLDGSKKLWWEMFAVKLYILQTKSSAFWSINKTLKRLENICVGEESWLEKDFFFFFFFTAYCSTEVRGQGQLHIMDDLLKGGLLTSACSIVCNFCSGIHLQPIKTLPGGRPSGSWNPGGL